MCSLLHTVPCLVSRSESSLAAGTPAPDGTGYGFDLLPQPPPPFSCPPPSSSLRGDACLHPILLTEVVPGRTNACEGGAVNFFQMAEEAFQAVV